MSSYKYLETISYLSVRLKFGLVNDPVPRVYRLPSGPEWQGSARVRSFPPFKLSFFVDTISSTPASNNRSLHEIVELHLLNTLAVFSPSFGHAA